VASRRGVPHYHRPHWPRRTRCKEGNLSWFYDNWGYADYDVVAQLDCDHVPGPTYLAEMVRPFADPAIGYVAAPSICDRNAASSWAARGRLFC
jgi:cellulose synthase/poly-beta-1,6-N-acetylglucosamine synthase-like glycosyltransferase